MSRAARRRLSRCAFVLLTATLCSCERGLADRQAELALLAKDEAGVAAQLNALSRQVSELKARAASEETRAGRSLLALREFQVEMVEVWKGDPAALSEWKKKAKVLPRQLEAALDLAQSVAGGEAVEKRFVRAVEANKPGEVGEMLQWWENGWVEQQLSGDGAEEEQKAKVCPTTRTLSCTPIDDDSLWCPDPEQSAAWAMLLENGVLTVGRMSAGQSHEVDARLAPRVWLTRLGKGDRGFVVLSTLRGNQFTPQWQTRLESEKTPGRPVESLKANFDADAFTEALYWNDEELAWLDPTDRDSVTVLHNVQACEALAVLEGVPAPVRERCRKLTAPPAAADAGP